MKTAFIFTGQGSQRPGMLNEITVSEDGIRFLNDASEILGYDVKQFDTSEAYQENENVQVAIFLRESFDGKRMLERISCDFVSGHSIGSFSAAYVADAINFEDALRLVWYRGRLMQKTFPSGYGMLAVENCDVGIVESTLPKFQEDHEQRVFLAVINEPSQSIFSGKLSELKAFEVFIHSLYPVKTRFLNIAVPSHCRLMDSVSALLKSDLETIHIKNPQIPYVSNYAAHRGRRAELVRDDFVYGVSHTVHWYDGITLLKECGATDFVEIGGSSILTDIGRRCYAELNWKIDT